MAAQIFDSIAHNVMGGAWREKKRRRMIDELRDHITVCRYGRVGRRASEAPDLNFEGIEVTSTGRDQDARKMFARRTSLLEGCGV